MIMADAVKIQQYKFPGSCVVHVSGGIMALVGAYLVGPRNGRFSGERE